MLELKDVVKVYAAKGGESVCALNHVSVRFGETGMVFLLGKSGSGKSTLLNVAGGLDFPTDGEIVVGTRSSASFSVADFDSYRNTYVGFVFQEYNLLDEFSVSGNVSLALELQGKGRDKAAIDRILEQVDLGGMGDRKPNTLSGGQKQRVAIARALVKDPKIIMADEPTGALDSETGKQVLDTLKKLSRDRLVLVVSHDREFAEQYADRIVELADGKIISDVTKTGEGQTEETQELCLKAGDVLTEEQLGRLKEIVECDHADVNVEADECSFRATRRVRKRQRGNFEQTGEVSPSNREISLIRSRLPVRRAFQIGLRGMKKKPFRLAFAILLSAIAFIVFGLMSSFMMYNPIFAKVNAINEQGYQAFYLRKNFQYNKTSSASTRLTEEELELLSERLGYSACGIISFYDRLELGMDNWNFNSVAGIVPMDESELFNNGFSVVCGVYPKNESEIAITTYQFDLIRTYGWKELDENGDVKKDEFGNEIVNVPQRYADVLGAQRRSGECWVTVTAVVDCGEIPERILSYRDDDENKMFFFDWLENSFHNCYFTVGDFVSRCVEKNGITSRMFSFYRNAANVSVNLGREAKLVPYSAFDRYSFDVVWAGAAKEKLADDEVIIERNYLLALCSFLQNRIERSSGETLQALKESEAFLEFCNVSKKLNSGSDVTETELKSALDFLNEYYESVVGSKIVKLQDTIEDDEAEEIIRSFRIVGLLEHPVSVFDFFIMGSDATFKLFYKNEVDTAYVPSAVDVFDNVLIPFNGNESVLNDVLTLVDVIGEDDSFYSAESMVCRNVDSLTGILSILTNVFLYGGLVFALFASLLLFNFISATVSYKKREIGILRAVGARRIDVFYIFFSESIIVMLVCILLSCIGGAILTSVMNGVLLYGISAIVSFRAITFGVVNVLIMFAMALVVAFLGTFLPVYRAAMKNPVESIRAE